uniref:Uncharacterized protein n=1 Tax=Globisporangium ultimum (strain ATCC 200006 / CBS 805.95 / DAOM BR144) TaxID=431595 RepID=K3XD38_GLOUD
MDTKGTFEGPWDKKRLEIFLKEQPKRLEDAVTDGKTVLVTGSNRGIGLAFVTHYATQGWNVIAAVRDVRLLPKSLSLFMLVQIDTSDEKLILKAANKLEGNPIDLLINNTGVGKLIVWMTRPRRSS